MLHEQLSAEPEPEPEPDSINHGVLEGGQTTPGARVGLPFLVACRKQAAAAAAPAHLSTSTSSAVPRVALLLRAIGEARLGPRRPFDGPHTDLVRFVQIAAVGQGQRVAERRYRSGRAGGENAVVDA